MEAMLWFIAQLSLQVSGMFIIFQELKLTID